MMKTELERIELGAENENNQSLLASFLVRCNGNASEVLNKCKEIMKMVLVNFNLSHTLNDWLRLLPAWFIEASGREITREEAEERIKLTLEERGLIYKDAKWPISSFVYWFQPEMRQWFWWDAKIENPNLFRITVQVDGFPFPSGSLKWLALASGAVSFDEE